MLTASLIFKITQNYIVIFLRIIRGKKLLYSVKFLISSIKSINSMKNYPHIVELFAYILNVFVFMFLLTLSVLIFLGTSST